jgi:hypothetical protein
MLAGANFINYTWTVGGKYWCEVTDGNDCKTLSDTVDTEKNTAIRNSSLAMQKVRIYPNPSSAKVFIEADFDINVVVTDVSGRVIIKQENTKEVNLAPYADAVYIFTLTTKDGALIGVEKIDKLSSVR